MAEFLTELNMGPQHPCTHGVLRIALKLSGETVVQATPDIGYLHRGIEKLAESWSYTHIQILADRIDYLSPMNCEQAYCMAVEKLMGIEVPERAEYIRVIMAELQRLCSHLVWWGVFGLDMGAVTPFLYGLREREAALDLFEAVAGARMTVNYMRPGGVRNDLTPDFGARVTALVAQFRKAFAEYNTLLSGNPILQGRLKGVAVLSPEDAISFGCSGGPLRGSGVNWDVRKNKPYSVYDRFDFDVPLGTAGDCWDRYIVKVREMSQSLRIIEQAMAGIPEGPVMAKVPRVLKPPAGEAFVSVEAPRGEVSIYLVSDGGTSPYKMHFRSPTFVHLQLVPFLAPGLKIADLVALTAGLDIVLGEVDR